MKYGFVIDNRKCIGCHACTTACKSEHEVPVGVNRTWVKQVETGTFPDTRRLFTVMRCNHCTDAPCVSICPTSALEYRPDGIVDLDKDRCIGCKSCMQACPYDALYIDPETNTAAKCNYCANRIDVGLEPACVNVCPEHAIISGDMNDPNSEISSLLADHETKVRKPEKATHPNVFYIDAEDVSLIPSQTSPREDSLWGSQSLGVGHYAKEAEKLAFTNGDVIAETLKLQGAYFAADGQEIKAPKSIEGVMQQAKEVYNTPQKGILWGWEVSAYIWTKALAAGVILIPFLARLTGLYELPANLWNLSSMVALLFLVLTGVLLIKDLDQPKRFSYVLLRPHWKSWLVKGGYAITAYGLVLTVIIAMHLIQKYEILPVLYGAAGLIAVIVAIYTAFLFRQAKGRDFWQSRLLPVHMLIHALLAGVAFFLIICSLAETNAAWNNLLVKAAVTFTLVNVAITLIELFSHQHSADSKAVSTSIVRGQYRNAFWIGSLLVGSMVPVVILLFFPSSLALAAAGVSILLGSYISNHIWVEAPQRIALS